MLTWPYEIRNRCALYARAKLTSLSYLALAYEVKGGTLFGPADKDGNRIAIEAERVWQLLLAQQ